MSTFQFHLEYFQPGLKLFIWNKKWEKTNNTNHLEDAFGYDFDIDMNVSLTKIEISKTCQYSNFTWNTCYSIFIFEDKTNITKHLENTSDECVLESLAID